METVRRRLPKRAGGPKHHDAVHCGRRAGPDLRGQLCAFDEAGDPVHSLKAARQVEVRRAAWDQFDLKAAVCVKPAENTRNANSNRVPLSRQALEVLPRLARGPGALLFPCTRPGATMGNSVMAQVPRSSAIAASGHGFRSSFKDWARHHDVDELLSEFALAHVEGSAMVAAYARDDLLEKRRPVLQRWADCIEG